MNSAILQKSDNDINQQTTAEQCSDMSDSTQWETVCYIDDLIPNIGVRVLLGEYQVAVFRISGVDTIYAIDAFDPFSEAAVLSRGIVGDLNSELVVASPIYKQHFSLRTGQCIEDPDVKVRVFAVRVEDGAVKIERPAE